MSNNKYQNTQPKKTTRNPLGNQPVNLPVRPHSSNLGKNNNRTQNYDWNLAKQIQDEEYEEIVEIVDVTRHVKSL